MTIHRANHQGYVSSVSRRHVVPRGVGGRSLLEARIGDNVGDGSIVMTPGPGVRFRCATDDGEMLAGLHYRGPTGGPGWVVAHGFTHGIDKPATQQVMATFATHGGVVAVDFRGHGRSTGRSSVGRDEILDLDAAVRWARELGYSSVAVVGFSLGAAVALRHASHGVDRGDAVVAVSAPSRWYIRETTPMRRVHWLLESPAGPVVGRVLGVRLTRPWEHLPPSPVESMANITVPCLLVHGTKDDYFGPAHAEILRRASGGAAELWIEQDMGHGETGTSAALIHRIALWTTTVITQAADERAIAVHRAAGAAEPGPER